MPQLEEKNSGCVTHLKWLQPLKKIKIKITDKEDLE